MKKFYIPILICAAVTFNACNPNLLEIPQKGVAAVSDFYITDADAESALAAAYHNFATNVGGFGNAYIYSPYIAAFNLCGDDMLAAGNFYGDNDFMAAMNEFRYDDQSAVIKNSYNAFYQAIYYDNLVTDHFAYGDSGVKDRCISEARVLRAFCHMMLAIGWDCPPLVDHVLPASDKPGNYEGGHKALLEWCAKECNEAAQYLDERQSPTDKNGAVKVTKGFAWSVAGKALLFAGDYADAKTALAKVINSKKYELVPGNRFGELFHIEGDGDEEKVFESNIVYSSSIGSWSGLIQRSTWMQANIWTWRTDKLAAKPTVCGVDGWGGLAVSKSFGDDMLANDGDSYRRKATFLTPDEFLYEIGWPDDATVTTLDAKKVDKSRGISSTAGLYGLCGYFPYKRLVSKSDVAGPGGWSEANFLIMRYAEVLLMYAEACTQAGDADGTGLKALNAVQTRAGSKHVSTSLTLSEVKNEKRFEMWLEGCRFVDMVRWGDAESSTVLANAGKNIPTLYDAMFSDGEAQHRFYTKASNPNTMEVGYKAKFAHFPYPFSETSINPNIKQNTGW